MPAGYFRGVPTFIRVNNNARPFSELRRLAVVGCAYIRTTLGGPLSRGAYLIGSKLLAISRSL